MRKREVEKVMKRAIRSQCAYVEPHAKVFIQAKELNAICEMALLYLASVEVHEQLNLDLGD